MDTTFSTIHKVASAGASVGKATATTLVPIQNMDDLQMTIGGAQAGYDYTVETSVGAAKAGADVTGKLGKTVVVNPMLAASDAVGKFTRNQPLLVVVWLRCEQGFCGCTAGGKNVSMKKMQSVSEFGSDVFVGTTASAKYASDKTAQASQAGATVTKKGMEVTAKASNAVTSPVISGVKDATELTTSLGSVGM